MMVPDADHVKTSIWPGVSMMTSFISEREEILAYSTPPRFSPWQSKATREEKTTIYIGKRFPNKTLKTVRKKRRKPNLFSPKSLDRWRKSKALVAWSLLKGLKAKKPTAFTDGGFSFCFPASLASFVARDYRKEKKSSVAGTNFVQPAAALHVYAYYTLWQPKGAW